METHTHIHGHPCISSRIHSFIHSSSFLSLSTIHPRTIHSISHSIRSSIYIYSITHILSTSQLHSISIRYNHSAAASFNHPPSLPNPKVKLLGYVFPTLDALRLACSIITYTQGIAWDINIILGCVMGSNYIRLR
jgi:hypothetical protein